MNSGLDRRRFLRQAGGGLGGNVAAGGITQLLSGLPVQGVTNPRAAEGGADGERPEDVLARGPMVLRHRRQALSAADYESLAREASPAEIRGERPKATAAPKKKRAVKRK